MLSFRLPWRRPLEGEHEPAPAWPKPIWRRVVLTGAEVNAGRESWLRMDPATGLLEAVRWFPTPPIYASALPEQLSRELAAWLELAMTALEPAIAEDLASTLTASPESSGGERAAATSRGRRAAHSFRASASHE